MKTLEFYHMLHKYLVEGQFILNCSRRVRSDIRRACDKFIIKDGRLYYVGPNKTYMRLVVMSEEEKKFALNECHNNSETGNHNGVRGTRNRVIAGYYWPTLIKDVTEWVKSCEHCQSNINKMGTPALHAVKKAVPVKVLVTQAPAVEEVCHSEDLCQVEEDLQQSRIPIITTIEGATSSEEIKPYFRVVVGNIPTLLDPPLAQQLLGKTINEQSTQTSHTPHARITTTEKEADINYIYKRYLLQELEVRKADLQYTKLKIRKLELEIKKMEKESTLADAWGILTKYYCLINRPKSLRTPGAIKMADKNTRIAIVNHDKCKPKKCRQECKKSCPVVRMGKLCIEVTPQCKIVWISESLCIGCGICIKKCPFGALSIVNLPSNLEKETTHRYCANSFKLHRLPIPRPGEVLGLVGTNGIGKSTALKILAGKQKPNLGKYDAPPDWQEILAYFRGSELQNYFTKILEDDLKAIVKPQYVDQIPKTVKGSVGAILSRKDDTKSEELVCEQLDLLHLRDRNVEDLSGGELQRFACAVVCIQRADIFMFDEPSSYLDVKQRLRAAITIRSLISPDRYIIVVEHDLSVLDYLSDFICCLYGVPSAYGVVTMPFSVREGINIFLDGYVPTENLRFRETSLVFKVAETAAEEEVKKMCRYQYPNMCKSMGDFTLTITEGEFTDSEIMVMLGENGTGKTTFIRLLAGGLKPDGGGEVPILNVSYKPQKISPKFKGSVRSLLHEKIRDAYTHPQFVTDVMKPMQIESIIDQDVQNLSGGELQRVALALCLGKPADVYLIDEPSAYLDSEQRLMAARVIKRFILHAKKTAFVVEHDFIMATYLADRVIVFDGVPSRNTCANTPQNLLAGMNKFLAQLEITFRRDPNNFRPRINKLNSIKDVDQKKTGNYFFLDD
ncbi:hypothetical protein QTP70_020012 [Hemibagrus guttatus]|uniref:ATP-binding cassette sub-family E member 1 n=1 Tax=Hemibagrus guttatus TaxID=175788 RepID=A0AAE0QCY9_9TELE|nr:hypothetical protein QTP70_020012 [Hemibagrus guttatus]